MTYYVSNALTWFCILKAPILRERNVQWVLRCSRYPDIMVMIRVRELEGNNTGCGAIAFIKGFTVEKCLKRYNPCCANGQVRERTHNQCVINPATKKMQPVITTRCFCQEKIRVFCSNHTPKVSYADECSSSRSFQQLTRTKPIPTHGLRNPVSWKHHLFPSGSSDGAHESLIIGPKHTIHPRSTLSGRRSRFDYSPTVLRRALRDLPHGLIIIALTGHHPTKPTQNL